MGFCVVQAAMEICWPKALPDKGQHGTKETFVFFSFCSIYV